MEKKIRGRQNSKKKIFSGRYAKQDFFFLGLTLNGYRNIPQFFTGYRNGEGGYDPLN